MNDNTIYWVWLARTLGAGAKIADIINYFGSPEKLYMAGEREWRISGILTARQIASLLKFSPSECGDVLKVCIQNGWQTVTPDDAEYPKRLLEIPDYPAILFVWGDKSVLSDEVSISVVGTRKATAYSVRVTEALAQRLAAAGAVIVSGGALGIDSASHWGAISANGKTVAVLGCGLGCDYLKDNAALRREVAKHGAVITEYFPFTPASRTTFPMRNRIISGITLGTVVIEAGERSGSLITARLALEQGRDVFAIPGDVISSAFTGTNRLIHDGAKPVFSALDILEEYYYNYSQKLNLENAGLPLGEFVKQQNHINQKESFKSPGEKFNAVKNDVKSKPKPVSIIRELPQDITESAKIVYNVLGEEPMHIDDISEKSGLKIAETLAALTELELFSLVELTQGKNYQKI